LTPWVKGQRSRCGSKQEKYWFLKTEGEKGLSKNG